MSYSAMFEVHFDKDGLFTYLEETSSTWLSNYFKENTSILPSIIDTISEKLQKSTTGRKVWVTCTYDDAYMDIYTKEKAIDGIKTTIAIQKTDDIIQSEIETIPERNLAEMEISLNFTKEASENLYKWDNLVGYDRIAGVKNFPDPYTFIPKLILAIEDLLNKNTFRERQEAYFKKNVKNATVKVYLKDDKVNFISIDGKPIRIQLEKCS